MMQSRKIPYRTHQHTDSTNLYNLPPGRYAARVLEIKENNPPVLLFLMEDSIFSLPVLFSSLPPKGAIVTLEIDSLGKVCDLEILNVPISYHEDMDDTLRWRKLGEFPSRMHYLKKRHHIIQQIRHWFDSHQFIEVHTPILVKAPNPEIYVTPFKAGERYLCTSPEFHMKRLLVGGFEQIYQITSSFRNKEQGIFHNPEFTMIEWYRAFTSLDTVVADLEELFLFLSDISPLYSNGTLQNGEARIDMTLPWSRMTVNEVLGNYLKIDLELSSTAEALKKNAIKGGYEEIVKGAESYEQIFFRLWHLIEARLGTPRPLFVYDWPLPLASLAQIRTDHIDKAERVELYIAGVELANGFGELTDATEQRNRFMSDLKMRESQKFPKVPLDEAFLQSMEQGLPPSAGISVGLDRLVMLLTGASQIQDVLCFSWDEC